MKHKRPVLRSVSVGGFTLVELLVVISIIALLMAILIPALAKARLAAKKAVCLSTVKQLTLAWMAYASNNDEKLVNGAPIAPGLPCSPTQFDCQPPVGMSGNTAAKPGAPPPPDPSSDYWDGWHDRELPWIGPGWAFSDASTNPPIIPSLQQDACHQRCAMQTGALWKYVKDEKIYQCPTGDKGELVTYSIVDCMNGMWKFRDSGGGVRAKPHCYKTSGAIKKPSQKLVFIDEGRLSPDSYAVNIIDFRWYDPPPVRHGGGVVVSYADGHSAYWKWKSKWTVALGNLVIERKTPCYNTFLNAPGAECSPGFAADCAAYQDDYKMIMSTWGIFYGTISPAPVANCNISFDMD